MDPLLGRLARLAGAAIGAFAGIVAVQLMRLRRMEFLPAHPGFYINHTVHPQNGRVATHGLRFVVLGDSTTAGVGVDRAQDALPYLVARHLADAERRPVHVVSYGWAGARAAAGPQPQPRHAGPDARCAELADRSKVMWLSSR